MAGDVNLPEVDQSFNPIVQYSITVGHLPTGTLPASSSSTNTGKAQGHNAAGKFVVVPVLFVENGILGVGATVMVGMLGLIWWL